MQTLSALCNAPVVGLQAPVCDGSNFTQGDEILEVNQMNKILFQSGVLLLLLALMSTGHAQNERYIPVFCNQGHSLQDALDRATEGATVDVWGTCNEAVVIRTDGIRISAISGQTTNINPPAGSVAFTVRADNVEISNLNITGGTSAVLITDGSSATITNNQILNYTRDGILIGGASSGSIQDNFLSSTNANNSAIFVVGSASAGIDNNTIGASSASGILIAAASSALVGCNNISISHPFFAGIHVSFNSQASLGPCPNTISNSDSVGEAIFCSKSGSIFAEAAQIITAGAIDLHPNCEVLANPGVTFPPLPLFQTLVLKIDFTNEIFNAGSTATLAKGVRTYQEFGLLDAQGMPIGEYRFHAVSTLPVGSGAGWYGNESFDIFGEGVIEGISQADISVGLFPEGSIIGGTGRFAGASGEYSSPNGVTYTFTFENSR